MIQKKKKFNNSLVNILIKICQNNHVVCGVEYTKKSRLTTPQGKFKWYLTEKLSKNSFSKKKVTFANWVSAEKHLNVNLRLCDN